jgi:hypothetical protein
MRLLTFAILAVFTLPLALLAFKEGPLPNMTGGFGEPSCHSCHLDNPINAPGGTLTLEGIPSKYTPDGTYTLTIRIAREGLRRGGFEIGARFAGGRVRAKQAGAWRVLDGRAQLQFSRDRRVQFAQHTTPGTLATTRGTLAWTMEWTAPTRAVGSVQFNVAANASNDDASPLGDFIYLTEQVSTP